MATTPAGHPAPAPRAPRPTAPTAGRRVPDEAWDLGRRHEGRQPAERRTAAGAWFTPADVARRLASLADPPRPPGTVLDPACGAGSFLLAAHERWPRAALLGVDLDPGSVEVTRRALALAEVPDVRLETGDGLIDIATRADVILANPPFLSQLASDTARSRTRRTALVERYGRAATRYVDEAALFLLTIGRDLLADDGVAIVVLPEALLATADADAVRMEVAEHCHLEVVWRDHDGTFPGVPTCAVRLVRRPPLTHDVGGQSADGSWAHLLATGVPRVTVPGDRTLAHMATATADFREAYYLLAAHVGEAPPMDEGGAATRDAPPIVPVGLIDPAHLRWGEASVRFAKQRWQRPVAMGLPADFVSRRLGPKVLVATQTRVLEALVDTRGSLLPSTPVITMRSDRPWHVAAALTSPILTAIAARRHAGAARARGALKLSARQVLDLPLPHGAEGWDAGADLIEQAHETRDPHRRRLLVRECGRAMVDAYEVSGDAALLAWWEERLPRRG